MSEINITPNHLVTILTVEMRFDQTVLPLHAFRATNFTISHARKTEESFLH